MTDRYIGWCRRPGGGWQAVIRAATEDAAWQQLRQHVENLGAKLVDTYVGPVGSDPNGRRRAVREPSQRRCF